ncbi:hypothetical protein CCP3SC1_160047 [Gammaproteobacteria bacterium]
MSDFAAQLAALNEQYASQIKNTLDDLASCVSEQGPEIPSTILADLHARLHKLAGSGGTFGYPELSRQACELEVSAKDWLESGIAGGALR